MNSILGKQCNVQIERDLKSISKAFIEYLTLLNAEIEAAKEKDVGDNLNLEV